MKYPISTAVGTSLLILTSTAALAQSPEQFRVVGDAIKNQKPLDPTLMGLCRALGGLLTTMAPMASGQFAESLRGAMGSATVSSSRITLCKCPDGMQYFDGHGCAKPGSASKTPALEPKSVRMK